MMTRNHLIPALGALALSATLAAPLAAQDIGTVASLDPTLQGTPPGAGTRTLSVGSPISAGEVMSTGPAGRAQLLFLDQTTLSMAPSSQIVLDSFVYDPNGAANVGIQLTTGALRFVGGKATEDEAATITTPSATIGVRGSSTLVIYTQGRTYAIFIAGERLCITPLGGDQTCTSRRGGVLTDDGYQGRVDPAYLAQVLALIDGTPVPGSNPGQQTGIGPDNPPDRATGLHHRRRTRYRHFRRSNPAKTPIAASSAKTRWTTTISPGSAFPTAFSAIPGNRWTAGWPKMTSTGPFPSFPA